MKTALVLAALCTGATAFAPSIVSSRSCTRLAAWIPDEEMTPEQMEIKKVANKWSEVRLMDADQVESLEPEWKEAYNRFYEKFNRDMEYGEEIAARLRDMIEPPKVQKKSKAQKKRDKWAKVQARQAAAAK